MGSDQRLLETLATVCAAMSFADGDVDPSEIAAFHLVARDLGASPDAAAKLIGSAVARVSAPGAVPEQLIGEACRRLPKGNHPALFEAAVHVLFADGELANAECLRLAALAEFLDVPTAAVIASVVSAVHGHPNLKISLTEAVLR